MSIKRTSIQEDQADADVRAIGRIREPHTVPYVGGSGLRGGLTTAARVAMDGNVRTLQEYDRAQRDRERASHDASGREFAYRQYLRAGIESRDLSEGATPGSYLVPPALMGDLIFGVQYFSGILGRARLWHSVTPGGSPFGGAAQFPSIAGDVSNNVGAIGENTQNSIFVPSFSTVTFGNTPLWIAGNLARIGRALMQDAQTDVASMVNELFAQRIARALDANFAANMLANATNVTTTATNAAISLADLVSLFSTLDAAAFGAENAALVCSTATRWYLQTKLVDSQSRPIMSESVVTLTSESSELYGGSMTRTLKVPTLFGLPVVTSPALSNIGASNNVAILANFGNAFVFRFVEASVQRLVERFADSAETGFNGWFRADGVIADQAELAVLKMHS
jgi:HK97 family phage major capsid protein